MIIFTHKPMREHRWCCESVVQQTSPKTLKRNSQMKNKMTVFLIHFRRNAAAATALYFDYIFVTLQIAEHCFVRAIHSATYSIYRLNSPKWCTSEWVSECGWLYIFTSMCFFYIRIRYSHSHRCFVFGLFVCLCFTDQFFQFILVPVIWCDSPKPIV